MTIANGRLHDAGNHGGEDCDGAVSRAHIPPPATAKTRSINDGDSVSRNVAIYELLSRYPDAPMSFVWQASLPQLVLLPPPVVKMLALVTLALAAVASATNTTTTLVPVLRPECNKADPANLVPSKDITLNYGAKDESLVSVTLAMKYPSVVLEEVEAVAAVDCAATSITVTFNATAAFEQTSRDWQALDDFVMVTNHLGNCDVENERGFFLVDTVTFDAATLRVVANAHKSDVANTASKRPCHRIRM